MKRRDMIRTGAILGGGALALSSREANARERAARQWESTYSGGTLAVKAKPPVLPGQGYRPVVTPNGGSVPFEVIKGVKVFHITASEMEHEFTPGLKALCWGYNGRVNSTTIEAVEGERVRIYVTNRLKVPTTIHWHGLYLPNGMDGISGLTQRPIEPGETFRYEWTLRQYGTYMFHSHHDTMTQEAMGLIGSFIVHPRSPSRDEIVDRDFSLLMSEWSIEPGARRPNPMEMTDFNVLTFNGRAFPGTAPLVVKTGDRVRIRLGNLSAMDHHPIHLHGYRFKITATDGEKIPKSAQWPETTALVAVGQTRDIEFIADAPGDWLLHCHMTHHIMNQMGHDLPNLLGVDARDFDQKVRRLVPGYMTMGQGGMSGMSKMKMPTPENTVAMKSNPGPFGSLSVGGMFTLLKVRDQLDSYDEDPGWYKHPAGTVAEAATPEELARDGILT